MNLWLVLFMICDYLGTIYCLKYWFSIAWRVESHGEIFKCMMLRPHSRLNKIRFSEMWTPCIIAFKTPLEDLNMYSGRWGDILLKGDDIASTFKSLTYWQCWGFPGSPVSKTSPFNVGHIGSILAPLGELRFDMPHGQKT